MTQYLATGLMSAAGLGHKRAGYLGIFTGGQSWYILRGGTASAVQPWGCPGGTEHLWTPDPHPVPCTPYLPPGDRKRAPGVTHPQQVRPIRSVFHPTKPKLAPPSSLSLPLP